MIQHINLHDLFKVPPNQIDHVLDQARDLYNLSQDSQRGAEIALSSPITYDDGEKE